MRLRREGIQVEGLVLTDGRVQAAGAGIAPSPRAQLCPRR